MRCPSLIELPAPPSGKVGWPWTEESRQLPDVMPDGRPWPLISIATPSYNQGPFIEETIRSVLLQGYPCLEYIVIDGGSTDNSVDIIKKYDPWLSYWISERDKGQAHAINKGFSRATGDILAWINSDDYYYANVFRTIARIFGRYPKVGLVHGYEDYIDRCGHLIQKAYPAIKNARALTLYYGWPLLQLTCFWRKEAYLAVGELDETLHISFDYDLFLRIAYRFPSTYIPFCVGAFRRYPSQKSEMKEVIAREHPAVWERFISEARIPAWKYGLFGSWYRLLGLWSTQGANGIARSLARYLSRSYAHKRAEK